MLIYLYAENHFDWLCLNFHPILTAYQLLRVVKLSSKNFDVTNWLRDSKSNYLPKISLIGWVWNSAPLWQIISCYKLSSCHWKSMTSETDSGITNLIACQKLVWLVEIEILPYFDSFWVVTSCHAVTKNFWLYNFISGL